MPSRPSPAVCTFSVADPSVRLQFAKKRETADPIESLANIHFLDIFWFMYAKAEQCMNQTQLQLIPPQQPSGSRVLE